MPFYFLIIYLLCTKAKLKLFLLNLLLAFVGKLYDENFICFWLFDGNSWGLFAGFLGVIHVSLSMNVLSEWIFNQFNYCVHRFRNFNSLTNSPAICKQKLVVGFLLKSHICFVFVGRTEGVWNYSFIKMWKV